jgi:NAD(P)H-flavin reductase/fatty-acid desaturase
MTIRADIAGHQVEVEQGETLLDAALRSGLDFPHSCKVGGCGSCRCKLAQGDVIELTETAYLLSQEELDDGVILACQSVPKRDVVIDVELTKGVPGTIVEQVALTHDTVALTIELDEMIDYRAGQYANVRIEGLDGVARSYSFASPSSTEGRATFFIRHVPGGLFSGLVNEEDVVGRQVWVDGPKGDFWLRGGDSPLVFVAGGSGLAPIRAMLLDALDAGVDRPVQLYFGARTQADLYCIDEIEALAEAWRGEFEFYPVLSDAPSDSDWAGLRGLVTEHLAPEPKSQAYLCGPPAMVDAGVEALAEHGIHEVYYDRFTTQAEQAVEEKEATEAAAGAGLLEYLKFFSFHAVGLTAFATLVAGGAWIPLGLLVIVGGYILGDALLGDDTTTPVYRHPTILTVQLWMALPLLALITFASVWTVSSADVLGFGALIHTVTGYDALAAREATGIGAHIAAVIMTGLMIGMIGTIPAHELTHRTWDKVSMFVGRWLLAFSFDTIFSIEHVYGHHRYVSTEEDPATAPRGRNVYAHVAISTVKGNVSAWHIETERLAKKRLSPLSPKNMVIRGHLMSLALVGLAALMGGVVGALYFVACGLWGKALLEIVNYMEHYGMVRNPTRPVQPRHSWNTNRRVSSWSLFHLTRHSHHHAEGEVPYHELRPYPDAPMMIGGYLTTIVVAMIPPLWHKLMTPKLLAWDKEYATPEERRMAARANAKSGIPALMEAAGVSPQDSKPAKLQSSLR